MFAFVSGNLALDFAGTVKGRATRFEDMLVAPADLDDWLIAAELLDTAPHSDAGTLERAVRLREAGYRLALAATSAEPYSDSDVAIVNEFASGTVPRLALGPDATITRTGNPDEALAVVARAAVELLGGPDRHRVKECGRTACTRLYVDTSRGSARRWCDMTICGNRAKSAAFRARHTSD